MGSRRERLRWWIAHQLNRLPGQCWADLVFWVHRDNERTLPWSPISPGCKQDFARIGACYCGKLRAARQPACGYAVAHPSHDYALPDEDHDGEFGPRRWCDGVPGDWQQPMDAEEAPNG